MGMDSASSKNICINDKNAREKILGKIRNAQLRIKTESPEISATTETVEQHLHLHPRGPQPSLQEDLLANFKQRALKLSSDVLETSDRQNVPALLLQYLNERKLPNQGICWPILAGLP